MTQISIFLKSNSERERLAKELLEQILNRYNLEKWILCNDVVIEEGATGKAFPIIRLSAWKDIEGGLEGMMAQFLHEQFHWIHKDKKEQIDKMIEELKTIFPDAPMEKPEGGGNEFSTYNHLMVCRLEFLALKEVLGEEKARKVISGNNNYTWIRKMIIEKGFEIDTIVKRYFPEAFKPVS